MKEVTQIYIKVLYARVDQLQKNPNLLADIVLSPAAEEAIFFLANLLIELRGTRSEPRDEVVPFFLLNSVAPVAFALGQASAQTRGMRY
jgi:hypothetical protein